MKKIILSSSFLLLGVIVGSVAAGYFLNGFYERRLAMLGAMELTSSAMEAQSIKMGNAATILGSLERTLPHQIVAVSQDPRLRDTLFLDTAMRAAKEFYVCTQTTMSPEISDILQRVELPDNACPGDQ